MIHVLLLNKDPLVSTTLRLIFTTNDDFHFVVAPSNIEELASNIPKSEPDVIVIHGG